MNLHASLLAFVAVGAFATAGCWVEPAPRRHVSPPDTTTPATPQPTPEQPRIPIDTGRTLHAAPGEGAGLFVTYAAGGQWSLTWTCDTKLSPGSNCPFEISVGTTEGFFDLEASPSTLVEMDGAKQSFRIRSTTTTTLESATFRVDPGAPIAISMRLRGQPYPNLLFFVSNGRLSTAPSDPIELVPTEP